MNDIMIRAERIPGEGFGIYTEDRRVHMLSLKQRMFAWHEASFYGTTLELRELENRRFGIVLPDLAALDYFGGPVEDWQLEGLCWGPELLLLQQASPLLQKVLREGRFMPDYSKWTTGSFGWKPVWECDAELSLWEHIITDSRRLHCSWLEDWLNVLLADYISHNDALQESMHQIAAAYPMVEGNAAADLENRAAAITDEEEWLVAIGWKQDDIPFRPVLRLREPSETSEWVLEAALLDKSSPDVIIPWNGSVQDLPDSWKPHAVQRLGKEQTRWLRALPWLSGEQAAGPGSSGGSHVVIFDGMSVDDPGNVLDGSDPYSWQLTEAQAWDFLTDSSLKLADLGSLILLPSWWEAVRKQKLRLKAQVRSSVGSSGNSMFGLDAIVQFDWRLAVGNLNLTEEEFRRLSEENRRLIQLDGQWVLLDPTLLAQIRAVMKRVQKKRGLTFREVMELHLPGGEEIGGAADGSAEGDAGLIDESGLRLEVELNEHLGHMLSRLQNTTSIPVVPAPESLHGDLRRYQQEGVSWMVFLQQFGLGGCLADDMGLGKTIQWIAYLLHIKHHCYLEGPALLVCPTSVIGNWQLELERFAPELRIHLHYGARRCKDEAFSSAVAEADVVITSYTLSHVDEAELSSVQWGSLCLDEAQNIKNAYTKQAGAIRKLNARHRIALTGTPIENRLTELWSIFDYINPGYLGSLNEFKRTYVSAVEKGDEERISQVQKLVRPFLLRRVKKDPAIQLDLPDKNEMKTFVPLTLEQGTAYESILQNMFDKLDQLSPMERRGQILATLTRLKQVCDHPALLQKADGGSKIESVRSAKLTRLMEMVEELRSEGDKCLIFTQFVEMGHILKQVLERELGESVLFLHGGVPKAKRDEMIAGFQGTERQVSDRNTDADEYEVTNRKRKRKQKDAVGGIFVLSLKAGGTGLNLTAANHVFHFDRWWNPAVENQATDRAFRIGQTRDVQVHKFISLGTLEERIDQMIEKKQGLSQQIIGGGENWITEMSTSELRELFALRRQWIQE